MKKNLLMLVLLSLVITTNAQQQGPPKPPMEQERNDGKGQRGGRFKDRGPKPEGKEKIEMFKIEFITKKLSLTTNEAELFWPVYNAHKKAMKEIIENKSNDEIQLQEAILNARKNTKTN